MWVHFIVKHSHVADGIIPFQLKDLSSMFAELLFQFWYKTNKTQPYVLSGSLASYFEGGQSKVTGEL